MARSTPLRTLGLPAPLWLADSAWAFPAIVLVSLLQIGEGICRSARGIAPRAAGLIRLSPRGWSNRLQMFSSITFPLLIPWLAILTVRDAGAFLPAHVYACPYHRQAAGRTTPLFSRR
ncbi:hypothetical protein [Candidatus Villigracilis saccharophilus]|uniref:hypothetical protein n=1 Tax=Candidatus Villigracilis saccharophilus TaxID=3140684 RepID=UPI00313621F5|nr:hypothetical protein [Anaerolineales bacterium]